MDKIIEYLQDNPMLTIVCCAVLGVCLVLAIVISIARKSVVKKRKQKELEDAISAEKALNSSINEEEQDKEETDDTLADDVLTQEEGQEEATEDEPNSPAQDAKEETIIEENSNTANDEIQPEAEKADEEVVATEIKAEEAPIENKEVKKVAPKKKPATKTEEAPTRYSGKWVITQEDKRFSAELRASNGELLLRSESYSALSGVKSGIETIKNNIEKNNFAIAIDKNDNFFFKLYSSSTRLLCVSEGYATKSACERAIESVKRFAKTAVVTREKKEEDKNN